MTYIQYIKGVMFSRVDDTQFYMYLKKNSCKYEKEEPSNLVTAKSTTYGLIWYVLGV